MKHYLSGKFGGDEYGGYIGEKCSYWAFEEANQSTIIIYTNGKCHKKEFEYMKMDELIALAEKYLLLI